MQTNKLDKNISSIILNNNKYIVPLYQRNFAWGEDEISQLLQDIYDSYQQNKDKPEKGNYYIGSLVVIERENGDYEIIDGQQRLTAITLIAKILKPQLKEPKLFYDSRPEVEAFYRSFYQSSKGETNDVPFNHAISHLFNAVDIIKEVELSSIDGNAIKIRDLDENFKEFFFNNVIIVFVELPKDTDVANYFEIMNNRGQQLQKHEVLKAKLLNELKNESGIHDLAKQKIYSKIWDACSQMNTHIQKLFKIDDRKILFGENYDSFPTKEKIERLIFSSNIKTKEIFIFTGFLKVNENTLIIKDQNLENITVISGELGGAWINRGKPRKAEKLNENKDEKQIEFQLQIHDDNYVKGVKAQLLQQGKDIIAKIIWAKSSDTQELFGNDWDKEEMTNERIATSEKAVGYGICKLELELKGISNVETQSTIESILSLGNVIAKEDEYQININDNIEDESDDKSIIDFPNFLMHILRLKYNNEYKEIMNTDIPLNEKDLLTVHKVLKDKIVTDDLISDILYYRTVYDRYIVKATTDELSEDEFRWTVKKPQKYVSSWGYKNTFDNESTQNRIVKCLSMLQVTFRSRIYKNWLQKVLSWFTDEIINENDYLRKLDELVLQYYKFENEIDNNTEFFSKGTDTPHFLFNFIDYLYWVESKRVFNFDFRYRNSVEHHLPQSFESDNYPKTLIDNLGNLCLVSKNANSRMNNESPVGKADKNGKFYKENLPPKRKRMYDLTNDRKNWGKYEIEEIHYKEVVDLLKGRDEILFRN